MKITSEQICEDLLLLIGRTKVGITELTNDMQLTPIQFFTLYAVSKGEATMGRVAGTLHCDPSNVTGIIDRLTSQGLVVRREDVHDRRARTLQLTSKGEQTVRRVLDRLPEYIGCRRLSSQELTMLHTVISKLTQ